jgi:hypothetical protein
MNGHVISDEVLDKVAIALSKGNNWMVYNNSLYFIDPEDVNFFDNKDSANEFSVNNDSDYDHHAVMYVSSVADVLRKIPYEELLNKEITNPDANGLYNTDGNAFTDALIDHIEQQQILINKKINFMNQKNFEYLKDQVKFTGFGSVLENELKGNIEKQTPEFQLTATTMFGNDDVVARLHFKKSNEHDMYFFNSYNLSLKNGQHPDPLGQTFYISNKQDNITLKEAYNLMSGRAVQKELTPKEGEKYKAWMQLDFKEMDKNGNYKMKQFHQNYGYDLAASLAKHPIKELTDGQDKSRLLESLQRGNRQSVTININGQEKKVFIEAAPQFKSLNFYDSNQQRLKTDRLYESNLPQQSVKQEVKKENQKQAAGDVGEGPAQQSLKKSRRNKQSIS